MKGAFFFALVWLLQILLVVSSSKQLVFRGDRAVDGGVGSLCWGLEQEAEGLS